MKNDDYEVTKKMYLKHNIDDSINISVYRGVLNIPYYIVQD
jgi:hypothetical protein